jgi:hypothetical protein
VTTLLDEVLRSKPAADKAAAALGAPRATPSEHLLAFLSVRLGLPGGDARALLAREEVTNALRTGACVAGDATDPMIELARKVGKYAYKYAKFYVSDQ